jgi:hypothetical protein
MERVRSGRFTIVEIEHTAKAFPALNWLIACTDRGNGLQQSITETLMIPFAAKMCNILSE